MVNSSAMAGSLLLGEAFALGLASGPACVASCGPVLIPSLLAERAGLRLNARFLVTFLGTRLLGYLVFAFMVGEVGAMTSLPQSFRELAFGVVHLLLAIVLVWYAYSGSRSCVAGCGKALVRIGGAAKREIPGAMMLGFLTGVSLCPPFVAAGVRAAELGSVAAALFFFAAFFVGSSLWFVPFLGFGCIRRNEAVLTVARMAMVLIALYYGLLGVTILAGRKVYGYWG